MKTSFKDFFRTGAGAGWVPSVSMMKRISRWQTAIYRASGGRLWGHNAGLDMMLLTTRGRRSGRVWTLPLPYFRRNGELVTIASFGGHTRNPDWYENLCVEPRVWLQVGPQHLRADARTARDSERRALWASITAEQPRYLEYQRRTEREIPVVVFSHIQETPRGMLAVPTRPERPGSPR